MIVCETPEEKLCPVCEELLPSSAFHRDSARRDGLKYCCSTCAQTYRGNGKSKKRSYDGYEKECEYCGRTLSSDHYIRTNKNTDDGLEVKCITCRSWRNKKRNPTHEEIANYEHALGLIISQSIAEMAQAHGISSQDEVLRDHRSEFEQRVAVGLRRQELVIDWRLPSWIHKTSLPGD
jgi:hypothetical protein